MLVAPEGGPHSFQWHSDDGEVHVLPHAAVAPHVEAFVLPAVPSAPHVLPHGALAPLAPALDGGTSRLKKMTPLSKRRLLLSES